MLVFLLVGVTSAGGLKCPPKITFNLQMNNVIVRWFMVSEDLYTTSFDYEKGQISNKQCLCKSCHVTACKTIYT